MVAELAVAELAVAELVEASKHRSDFIWLSEGLKVQAIKEAVG